MTRPRPTGLSVLRSCTHCHGSESESWREREGERAYIYESASESDGRPRGTSARGVLAWMTRHCRGARVPRTLGQQCACVHVRSCEWRGVPVTSSGDPPGLAPIRIYIEWYSHQWCMYTGVYIRGRGATNTLTWSRRSLAVIAHTSTTQLLAARCGIIYPII